MVRPFWFEVEHCVFVGCSWLWHWVPFSMNDPCHHRRHRRHRRRHHHCSPFPFPLSATDGTRSLPLWTTRRNAWRLCRAKERSHHPLSLADPLRWCSFLGDLGWGQVSVCERKVLGGFWAEKWGGRFLQWCVDVRHLCFVAVVGWWGVGRGWCG